MAKITTKIPFQLRLSRGAGVTDTELTIEVGLVKELVKVLSQVVSWTEKHPL